MITLTGKEVYLRALEPEDIDLLYTLENKESLWEVSNTQTPFSKFILTQYIENAHRDIYDVKQLRLVICKVENDSTLGFIDLFDFDPKHRRAGLGIVIFSEKDKNKGFASEALGLLSNYSFVHLNLHQLYANISEDNKASIRLFEKTGFVQVGLKKDWIFSEGIYKNEYLYQLLNKNVL